MRVDQRVVLIISTMLTTISVADNFGSGVNEFEIDFALMGNAGNTADTGGYGDVAYNYKIGKYEVTVEQFSKAWNLDNTISDGDEGYWNNTTHALGQWAPACNVSWQEAAKFCNWLTSGSSTLGAYTVAGGVVTGVDRVSAVDTYETVYVIPTEDEWYKAAYHTGSGYSVYANGTSIIPVKGSDGANYDYYYPYPGRPWVVWEGGGEHNATENMNGNMWEICEDLLIRGGAFDEPPKGRKDIADDFFEAIEVGLRVAAISSLLIGEDDFNDNALDTAKWDFKWQFGGGDFVESAGRLNFTRVGSVGGSFVGLAWEVDELSYTQDWSIVVDIAHFMTDGGFGTDESVDIGLSLENDDVGFQLLLEVGEYGRKFITEAFDVASDQSTFFTYENSSLNEAILKIEFDASEERMFTYYGMEGCLKSFTNVSTAAWGMTGSSTFFPMLFVDCEAVSVATGQVYADDFKLFSGRDMSINLPFEWKQLYFPGGYPGDEIDSDGDTLDNRDEYIAGTDPTNSASVFAITQPGPSPSGFVLNWTAIEGRVYSVRWSDSLTNRFQTLESNITPPQNSYTDTVHAAEAGGVYNLKVELGN